MLECEGFSNLSEGHLLFPINLQLLSILGLDRLDGLVWVSYQYRERNGPTGCEARSADDTIWTLIGASARSVVAS